MSLPGYIEVERELWARSWGSRYQKDGGTPLYCEMNGGWTAAELRSIADDLDERQRTGAAGLWSAHREQ